MFKVFATVYAFVCVWVSCSVWVSIRLCFDMYVCKMSSFVWVSTANCWQCVSVPCTRNIIVLCAIIGFIMRSTFPFWCRLARSTMYFSHGVLTESPLSLIGSWRIDTRDREVTGTTCDNKAKARVCHDAAEAKGILTLVSSVAWMEHHSAVHRMFILCWNVPTTERIARDESGRTKHKRCDCVFDFVLFEANRSCNLKKMLISNE